ncbi:hypothetical protein E0F15_11115 [Frankia sp. B2]|uniref:hypothetical protein n=1 Tax=Frankia sp. B2 TaxID=2541730 RepID=UPI00106C6CD1|nr:hypothetical protein [Frankia sp. B2]TFE31025.1 hypothetical protein E0F15_11115 [Frankia sp. B2]
MPSNNADTATADTTRVLTALVDGPLSAPDIATRTGIEVRTVRNLLASLADAERIRKVDPEPTPGRAGRHAARWALPATGTTDHPTDGEPEGASPAPALETSTPDPDPERVHLDSAIGGAQPTDDETDDQPDRTTSPDPASADPDTPAPDTLAPAAPEAELVTGGADSPADDEPDQPADDEPDQDAADLPAVSESASEPGTGAEESLDGGPDDTPTGADAAVSSTTAPPDADTGSADGGPEDVASLDPATNTPTANPDATDPSPEPLTAPGNGPAGSASDDATGPEPAAVSVPVCAALACPLAACPARTGITAPAPRRRARATAPRATGDAPQLNRSGSVRLRPGQLGVQIGDLLRDHPTAQLSSGEIARELKRSSGAVAAAMPGLINTGRVRQVNPGERPARYQTTGTN